MGYDSVQATGMLNLFARSVYHSIFTVYCKKKSFKFFKHLQEPYVIYGIS